MILGIDFPPISHAVEWKNFLGGDSPLGVNKVVLLMWVGVVLVFGFFMIASRKGQLIPTGVQNLAESAVDFIRDGIIMQTMGSEGLVWTPFLLTMFSFILIGNIWEIIPLVQMPVNARIALPMFMALLVYVIYHAVGVMKQGVGGYLKSSLIPPGVPKAILPLLMLIELITMLITKPLSLCVRLFANMFAGHLLLITFSVISATLWSLQPTVAILPFSFFLLVALTGFEVLVAFLQAFIFTILTGVYISQSMHADH